MQMERTLPALNFVDIGAALREPQLLATKPWELQLAAKAPKTINNALTVLNVLLKQAVAWELIERVPCSARLLPVSKPATRFTASMITSGLSQPRGS